MDLRRQNAEVPEIGMSGTFLPNPTATERAHSIATGSAKDNQYPWRSQGMNEKSSGSQYESDRKLVAILRTIREKDLHRVTEIAEELDMASSTVHSHLNSLVEYGFINREDRQYYLGLRFLDFGIAVRNERNLFRAAKEKVDVLAEETGERVWCVTESQGKGVYLYGATGNSAFKTYETIGQYRPLHQIAAGKAILAFLPDERVEEILESNPLEKATPNTITDPDKLREDLEEIREKEIAHNFEESLQGVNAIAAPIKKIDGGIHGAIAIGGPANRLTEQRFESDLTDLMLGAANEIEINIRHI